MSVQAGNWHRQADSQQADRQTDKQTNKQTNKLYPSQGNDV